MTSAAKKVIEDAPALPADERVALVDALNERLVGASGAGLSEAWTAEVASRAEAVERGDMPVVSGVEVSKRVQAVLDRS